MLLLTVCIVEETEGYNTAQASCTGNCFAQLDLCEGLGLSASTCSGAFQSCSSNCK